MIEKKIKDNGEHFCILVCTFSTQNETGLDAGLDAGLDGKSRPRSISISVNQIREFGGSQSL